MELLKQPQHSPYPLEQQVAILYLVINGQLMNVKVGQISVFVKAYLEYLSDNHADLMRNIGETGVVSLEQESELQKAGASFLGQFGTSENR